MNGLAKDVAYGFRQMARSPGLTCLAILAIALGIGLSATMFGLVNGLFFKGLPFPESHRLYSIRTVVKGEVSAGTFLPLRFMDRLAERQTSFESFAGHSGNDSVVLSEGDYPSHVRLTSVTANWLDVLQVEPLMGGGFVDGDDILGAEPKIILSYGVWVNQYARDPNIIGRTVIADGRSATVVGIMPAGFVFPDRQRAWMPAPLDHTYNDEGEGYTWLVFYGRLKDGVSAREAETEVENLLTQIRREDPYLWSDEDGYNESVSYTLIPTSREYVGEDMERATYPMLGAALLLLLIACSNVANLQLTRFSRRIKEFAIRSALGAHRRQIIRQIFVESLLISTLGAAIGTITASAGLRIIRERMAILEPPDWLNLSLDYRVLGFVLVLVLASAFMASLAPVWFIRRARLHQALNDESRGATGFHTGRIAKGLVIAQTAISTALLISMSLMIKTVHELRALDIPVEIDSILNVSIQLDDDSYRRNLSGSLEVFRQLIHRLNEYGEVERSAITNPLTFKDTWIQPYHIEDEPVRKRADNPTACFQVISPDYFSLLGTPLLQGREFSWQDTPETPLVCLVNRPFIEKHWPNETAVGKRMRIYPRGENQLLDEWMTVIGVVPDLKMGGVADEEASHAGFYVPLTQFGGLPEEHAWSINRNYLLLKTKVEPRSVARLVRKEVSKIDPRAPVFWERTLHDILAEERAGYDLTANVFVVFGLAALFLTVVGIFGVMSSAVNHRVREIGVRMALGGYTTSILGLVLGQGFRQLAIGSAIGLGLSLFMARFVDSLLYQVSPYDPLIFVSIPVLLSMAGIAAVYLPARRAASIHPMEALREE